MANNKKRIKKEELRKKEKQFKFYSISFAIILFMLVPIGLRLINSENIRGLLFGIFLLIYSVIGSILKMPLFNRQYMYGSSGFDNSFGFRNYFGYVILFLFGVIFTFSFFNNT